MQELFTKNNIIYKITAHGTNKLHIINFIALIYCIMDL